MSSSSRETIEPDIHVFDYMANPQRAHELDQYVDLLATQPAEQRRGQWAFNALLQVRFDLAQQVRAKPDLDPYYRDELLPAFYEYIWAHWFD